MCGRYILFSEDGYQNRSQVFHEIIEKLGCDSFKCGEIYPTDAAPVLLPAQDGGEGMSAELFRWGFLWSDPKEQREKKQGQKTIINARAETVLTKPMFAGCFENRRCIIPAAGFFEWKALSYVKGKKQKYLFTKYEKQPLYMAGLYTLTDNEWRFVILTTEANKSMEGIHDRMPLIFDLDQAERWLYDKKEAKKLLAVTSAVMEKEMAETVLEAGEQLSFLNSI